VTAGEVARRAGVSVGTLRYYERRGLLPEPARTPGGHRRYDEEAVRFLRSIKEAQAIGFTLAELRALRVPGRRRPPQRHEDFRLLLSPAMAPLTAACPGQRHRR
jgi:DNA-binding transcriptional MerR regulator